MPSQRPGSGGIGVNDLESTARLPVLKVAPVEEASREEADDEAHQRTTVLPPGVLSTSDTHPGIPILKEQTGLPSADVRVVVRSAVAFPSADSFSGFAEDARADEAEAPVPHLLERQAELLREIQDTREEAEARYQRLESDLDVARRLGEDLDSMRRDAESRAWEAEQRVNSLEAKFTTYQQQFDKDIAVSREQFASQQATQVAAHAIALQAARAEAADFGRQLQALRARHSLDEAGLGDLRGQLAAAHGALDEARSAQAESERELRSQTAAWQRDLESLQSEVAQLRAATAAQLEALQTAESRRGIWASLLGEAETVHEACVRELVETAASAQSGAVAAQAKTETVSAERATLQAEWATTRTALATAEAGLDSARAEIRSMAAERDAARAEAGAALLATQENAALELATSRTESTGQARRLEELESRLAGLQSREQSLLEQLEAASAQSVAQSARDEVAAATDAAADSVAEAAEAEALQGLQAELRRKADRVVELESDLRAAEEQIHRLEGELRSRNSRLEELSRVGARTVSAFPDVASIGGRRRDDYAVRARGGGEPGLPTDGLLAPDTSFSGVAASADGVTRYFVLIDGDTEIVHVLGRRTTLGRGLDNDVRIDTKFISRHHAVVLAGPNQTVIEDLRSTNGVLVNGRRVTRSVLRDGDIVHVGKTQFRFVQRSRER